MLPHSQYIHQHLPNSSYIALHLRLTTVSMDVHVYFTATLAKIVFGWSLWIEAIIKPLAEHSRDDDIINVPAMEAFELFTISFSIGSSIAKVRAAVLTEVTRPPDWHGGLVVCMLVVAGVVVGIITGATTTATVEFLVAARRGYSDPNIG
uniref:Uncharacterized protein n=1 Tax=Avena sativa TaxID=4498 RepID=A0ACD5YEX8_AVESA